MPTIRQAVSKEVSADRDVAMPENPVRVAKPLRLVKPGMSAIEHIVETARPGEVTRINEWDYYSAHLWSNYEGFDTRYSCTL